MQGAPQVVIVMGSASDLDALREAVKVLDELAVPSEVRVLSAHRTPDEAAAFFRAARGRGVKVIIAAAGGAAHLAGAAAAHTTLPVIGVPVAIGGLGGLDALLATVQMPAGVPVATVAIGGAHNAALLAVEILALSDEALVAKLEQRRVALRDRVLASDAGLAEQLRK
ncbi:MAG: 5-(carboxyamino)imidazole ribonucleotide mutase [Myxococcales bacterium]|nr:5-(carboxyamino)imidazole ribonucleotide mutase [Myxococcales bacterium]